MKHIGYEIQEALDSVGHALRNIDERELAVKYLGNAISKLSRALNFVSQLENKIGADLSMITQEAAALSEKLKEEKKGGQE